MVKFITRPKDIIQYTLKCLQLLTGLPDFQYRQLIGKVLKGADDMLLDRIRCKNHPIIKLPDFWSKLVLPVRRLVSGIRSVTDGRTDVRTDIFFRF